MPRSTIEAVGSKARCGSAVLISNERSTTSVALGADDPVVAPDATAAVARTAKAASAALVPGRVRKRFMEASGEKGSKACELIPPCEEVIGAAPVPPDEPAARLLSEASTPRCDRERRAARVGLPVGIGRRRTGNADENDRQLGG